MGQRFINDITREGGLHGLHYNIYLKVVLYLYVDFTKFTAGSGKPKTLPLVA